MQDQLVWPDSFLKGIALSVYQNSGDAKSNWTDFIKKKNYLGQKKNKAAFVQAADFWNMYETDIKMAADLGATAFRFSFEWARFMPDYPGLLCDETCARYNQILDCIEAHGMEPMVTLHHFVHPSWFEAMGAFTKEENLRHFVDYSTSVFQRFAKRIKLWSTFNEPTCYAFVGYIVGLWAPGLLMRLKQSGEVLGNLLKAHCEAYKAMKALPGGQQACIGMVHQHIEFYPRHNLPHVRAMCKWMTWWFGTHVVLKFFNTGVYETDTPFSRAGPQEVFRQQDIAQGKQMVDWWGINYYSRPCVHWNFSMGASAANEPVSDTHFRLYPQGLYDSIKDASVLKVPIYITETGLADKEDKHRAWYIRASYNMLLKSIADGYDVRGVFWWTLMDNIEWHEGFHIKFGLVRWDPEFADLYKDNHTRPPGGLQIRQGAYALKDVYSAWPNALPDLVAYAKQQSAGSDGIKTSTGVVAGSGAATPIPAVHAGTGDSDKGVVSAQQVLLVAASGSAAAVQGKEVESERVGLMQAAV